MQQPGHCTPLFLALALAYEQKQTWQRSRILVCIMASLNISHAYGTLFALIARLVVALLILF